MKSFSLLPKNKEQKSTKKNKNNIINFNYTQNYEDIIRDILNKDSKITSQKLTNCNSKYNLNGQGNEKDSDKKNNKENLYKKYDKKNAKTTKNKQFKNEKNEIKYRRSPTLRQDYTINLKTSGTNVNPGLIKKNSITIMNIPIEARKCRSRSKEKEATPIIKKELNGKIENMKNKLKKRSFEKDRFV